MHSFLKQPLETNIWKIPSLELDGGTQVCVMRSEG